MMYDPNFPNRPGPYDDPLRNKLLNRKIPENDTAAGWNAFAAIAIAPASSHIRNIRNIRSAPILQFFAYGHLPPHLANVSERFAKLAFALAEALPENPQRDQALELLLASKDCAVRAVLWKHPA